MNPLLQADQDGPVLFCPDCGRQLSDRALKSACADCLTRRYLKHMLKREREAWERVPFLDVELSRERGRLQHVVFKVDNGLAYCGARATESKKRRQRVKPEDLPVGACTDCVRNFRELLYYVRGGEPK